MDPRHMAVTATTGKTPRNGVLVLRLVSKLSALRTWMLSSTGSSGLGGYVVDQTVLTITCLTFFYRLANRNVASLNHLFGHTRLDSRVAGFIRILVKRVVLVAFPVVINLLGISHG